MPGRQPPAGPRLRPLHHRWLAGWDTARTNTSSASAVRSSCHGTTPAPRAVRASSSTASTGPLRVR
jgi:hypothetical protein